MSDQDATSTFRGFSDREYGMPVEILPNFWLIPIPIPIPALRYVLVYVFISDGGVYLIDSGWDDEVSWIALGSGLDRLGIKMKDVRGVLATHFHSDHYGLAGRIREHSGAWIGLHQADLEFLENRNVNAKAWMAAIRQHIRDSGVPPPWDECFGDLAEVQMNRSFTRPDIVLTDGYKPEIPGWDVETLWTPGHSPGHVSFYLHGHARLLSGDHVLPRISPNISYEGIGDSVPLADFLGSLDKVHALNVTEVLPSHQWRFSGLRQRVIELKEHHVSRLREIELTLGSGPVTAWDVAQRLKWSRPWDSFDGRSLRSALGETTAHLQLLVKQDRIRAYKLSMNDRPVRYELVHAGT